MVQWCPGCNAMLAPGSDKCPRCGKQLGKARVDPGDGEERPFTRRDYVWMTCYLLAMLLIPLVLLIVVGLACSILLL